MKVGESYDLGNTDVHVPPPIEGAPPFFSHFSSPREVQRDSVTLGVICCPVLEFFFKNAKNVLFPIPSPVGRTIGIALVYPYETVKSYRNLFVFSLRGRRPKLSLFPFVAQTSVVKVLWIWLSSRGFDRRFPLAVLPGGKSGRLRTFEARTSPPNFRPKPQFPF